LNCMMMHGPANVKLPHCVCMYVCESVWA
jgi:hypothetical protein